MIQPQHILKTHNDTCLFNRTYLLTMSNKVKERGEEQPLCRAMKCQPAMRHRHLVHQTLLTLVLQEQQEQGQTQISRAGQWKGFQKPCCEWAGVSKTSSFLQEVLGNLRLSGKLPNLIESMVLKSCCESRKGTKQTFVQMFLTGSVFFLPLQHQKGSRLGMEVVPCQRDGVHPQVTIQGLTMPQSPSPFFLVCNYLAVKFITLRSF